MLKQNPDDHAMRLLASTSYARLGLRTAAGEQLDRLPAALQGEESVGKLRQVLGTMGADEISTADRIARCDANLAVLRGRGVDLGESRAAWAEDAARERWFIARDGNIARRSAGAECDEPWIHFRNDRAEADTFPFPHMATPDVAAKPYVIEGLFPAWLLMRLWERTPMAADRYRTRISVVQEGEMEALDGLSSADLGALLADDRVELFIGAGAGERYQESLRQRMGTRAGGPYVTGATVRKRATPAIGETLQRFAHEHQEEHRRLLAETERIYAGRDKAWWARRYSQPEQPLRVLVPTCRYSTFVKHSASDLAEAFRAMGWEARVLMEPDDTSHLSSVAYLSEIATFQPDLVVLINYARVSVANFFPPTLPFVCWLQDAMPHQFDKGVAEQQGEYDFIVGYLHGELFREFGFSYDRAALFPVAVSTKKFHAGVVSDGLRERMACDIAYVSHHSETPAAMHERLVREASAKEPLAARIFEELRAPVSEIALDPMYRIPSLELRVATQQAARRVLGSEPPEGTITLITRQYCFPMADRLVRHQTLAWTLGIAERRGLRFRVYGRGWDKHPTLAPHAQPELAHDEELRASYQCAAVHLHASSNWLLHQRIMECALSGGLPLTRLKKTDLVQWEQAVLHQLSRDGTVVMEQKNCGQRLFGYAVADHPMSMEYAAQLQRLGFEAPAVLWMYEQRYDEFRGIDPRAGEPPAGWFLGDLSATTFRNESELEAMIVNAVNDPAWRARLSSMIAERTRRTSTCDALAQQVRELVTATLAK